MKVDYLIGMQSGFHNSMRVTLRRSMQLEIQNANYVVLAIVKSVISN